MTDLPWFPMYPADFLVSTAAMTPTQGWAYTQLLMYAWTNGTVPDDRATCSAMTRCKLTEADWKAIRSRFRPGEHGLTNPRMETERAEAKHRHARSVTAGKRGAAKRWGRNGDSPPNGTPNSPPIDSDMAPPMAPPMAITITPTITTTTTSRSASDVRPTRRTPVGDPPPDNLGALRALVAAERKGGRGGKR